MQTLLVVAAFGGIFGHGGIFSGAGLFGGGCANGSCSVGPSTAPMATFVQAAPAPVQYVQAPPRIQYVQAAAPVQASSCYSSVQASSCYSSQPPPPPPADSSNYEFSGSRRVTNPVIRSAPPTRTKFASSRQEVAGGERIPYAEPGPAYDEGRVVETPEFQFYHK